MPGRAPLPTRCLPLLLILVTSWGTVPVAAQGAPPAAPAAPATALAPFTAEDLLRVATLAILDVSEDGRWVAATARRTVDNAETDHARYGDPTYLPPARVDLLLVETATGRVVRPFADRVHVPAAAWSRDGARLALVVVDQEPTPGEPAVARAVARLRLWDVTRGAWSTPPALSALRVDPGTEIDWAPDGRQLVVAAREEDDDRRARETFRAVAHANVIVHSSKEPFLEWDALRRSASLRRLVRVDATTGATTDVAARRHLRGYRVARDASSVVLLDDVTEKTDYDTIGGRIADLLLATPGQPPKKVADGKELKGLELRWSDDGRLFAYAKKGEIFVQAIDGGPPRSLTPRPAAAEGDRPAAGAPGSKKGEPESFSPSLFSRDGSKLLVTSTRGWYAIDVASAARTTIVTLDPDHEDRNPRLQAIAWTPDGRAVLAGYSAAGAWARGLSRIDVTSGVRRPLFEDAGLYRNWRVSRDGRTVVFTASNGDGPDELHVARLPGADGPEVAAVTPRRLTDVNAWVATRAVPRSELVGYRDADGTQLYGVLRYPVGYEPGRRYPTVFEIYETFFDNGLNPRAALLATHGYAVFHPSVKLVVGRPGEAWLKGVTAAANRLVEMGVADPDRLGVHGTSYGGYATVLLISQTDRFKAAINVSGKVNMVSFYTDSPRLGVRNTHAPEKSQDRIGGTLWEYPERYLEHSAILRAERITTPLLCITGDLDPNVPASQSREIYYALRRLGREVEWVRYASGGHRPPNSVAESLDFEGRILAWYDKYLKAPAAPEPRTSPAAMR